jgi:sugar lactone lactonase YvrE
MKRSTIAVLFLAASAAFAIDQATRDEIRREHEAARAAHEKKDYEAFRAHSARVVELAPRSVGALYNLACAEALLGRADASASLLGRLAAMGVAPNAERDPDFSAVAASPAIVAAFARLAENRKPVERSTVAFTLPELGLLTEGVAYDPKTQAFFVSSVRKRKIVRRDAKGAVKDFVPSGQDGIFSAVALAVDTKRRALWVSSAAMPPMAGFEKSLDRLSFVLEYDVDTGRLRRKITPPEGGFLSDLSLGPAGELVVSDPYSGRLYLLENGAFRVLVGEGPIGSAQGLAFAPDGRLYVADYVQGPVRVDVKTGATRLLDVPADAAVTGIDGLVWDRGSLVGIQNGTEPHRVVRLSLDGDKVSTVTVLDRAHSRFDEPTLGVVVDDALYYVANSQYGAVRDDGSLDESRLKEPTILRLPLAR